MILLLAIHGREENNLIKKLILKFAGAFASLALMITSLNVNTTCMFIMHQPELPDSASKLRKKNVL